MNELYIDLLELISEVFPTKRIIAILEDKYDFHVYGSVIEGLPEFKRYILKGLEENKSILDLLDSLKILKELAKSKDNAAKELLEVHVKRILEKKDFRSIIILFDDGYFKFLPFDYLNDYIISFNSNYAVKVIMQKCIKNDSEEIEVDEQTIDDLLSITPYLKLSFCSRGSLIHSLLIDILTKKTLKLKFLKIFKERLDEKENTSQLLEVMRNFLQYTNEEELINVLGKELHQFYELIYKVVEFDEQRKFGHLEVEYIVGDSMSEFIKEKIIESMENKDFERFYLTYLDYFGCLSKNDLIKLFVEYGASLLKFILDGLKEDTHHSSVIFESEFAFRLKDDPDVSYSIRRATENMLKNYKFEGDDSIFYLEVLELVSSSAIQNLLDNPESGFFKTLLEFKLSCRDYYYKFLKEKQISIKKIVHTVLKEGDLEELSVIWDYYLLDDIKIKDLKDFLEDKNLLFLEKALKNAYHHTTDSYYFIPERVKTHLRPQLKESITNTLKKNEIDSFIPLLAMSLLDCFGPVELLSIIEDEEINLLKRIDEAIERHYDKIMDISEGFYLWQINFCKFLSKFNFPISDKISPYGKEVVNSNKKIQLNDSFKEFVSIAGRKIPIQKGALDLSNLNIYDLTSVEGLFNLKSLKTLILSNNFISDLTESIGNLFSLEELIIENCRIKFLPNSLGNLKNLKHLNLQGNQIKRLPESFGNLEELHILDLRSNNISYIPDSFKKLNSMTLAIDKQLFDRLTKTIKFLKKKGTFVYY